MIETQKIRPVYQELQGYLSQTLWPKGSYDNMEFDPICPQINSVIDELNSLTDLSYDKFKIDFMPGEWNSKCVLITTVRIKLGGLIDKLHGEYFHDENRPFSGTPQTVISQSQIQSQNINIALLLDINTRVTTKLQDADLKPEEKTFLETIRDSLVGMNSAIDVISTIINTASKLGITVSVVKMLLGL